MNFKDEKQKIDNIVQKSKRILVTSHIGPDLDAIGSVLSFKYYINKYFSDKQCDIYLTKPTKVILEKYNNVLGINDINETNDIYEIYKNYDTVVFLDGSELHRFTNNADSFILSEVTTICVDHHMGESEKFDYYCRDNNYCSCTQLLTDILFNDYDLKDIKLSEPLLLGIYSDTGSMKYISSIKSGVYTTVKRVVDNSDLNVQDVLSKLELMSSDDFEILKEYILNTKFVKLADNLPLYSYTYLNKSTINNLDSGDKVSVANGLYKFMFLGKINGFSWGYVITPNLEFNNYRISFRSLPSGINVNSVAKLFKGGGHLLASAGVVDNQTLGINMTDFEKLDSSKVCQMVNKIISNCFKDNIVEKLN